MGSAKKRFNKVLTIAFVFSSFLIKANAHPSLHVDPSVKECSIRFDSMLTQEAFHQFVREFGSVSAFKQMAPPSTLGNGKLLAGIEITTFTVDEHDSAWNDTFTHPHDEHPLGSRQTFPKFKFRMGVGEDTDIGAFYTQNFAANYGWIGVDLKQRLIKEGESLPVTSAIRGAYTKTIVVTDMDMHALTADWSFEKSITDNIKPYLGAGTDYIYAKNKSHAVTLRDESVFFPHIFGGVDFTLWQSLSIGVELTMGALHSTQIQIAGVF